MSSSAVIKLSSYSRAERDVSIPSGSKWGRMPHQRSLRSLPNGAPRLHAAHRAYVPNVHKPLCDGRAFLKVHRPITAGKSNDGKFAASVHLGGRNKQERRLWFRGARICPAAADTCLKWLVGPREAQPRQLP
jgi:hypothetical protein